MIVQLTSHTPDRSVSDNRERRANIHTRRPPRSGLSLGVESLIEEAHAFDLVILNERL